MNSELPFPPARSRMTSGTPWFPATRLESLHTTWPMPRKGDAEQASVFINRSPKPTPKQPEFLNELPRKKWAILLWLRDFFHPPQIPRLRHGECTKGHP